jgi:hypothetical protein
MDPQMHEDSSSHQMPAPMGQQIPMNPGQFPNPYMQMMPPFMFPSEGATAQDKPTPEQQAWMQQMQIMFMYHKQMQDQAAPPPYAASEENSGTRNVPGTDHQNHVCLGVFVVQSLTYFVVREHHKLMQD